MFLNFSDILETTPLLASISFSERRRNRKGPNQASKEGEGTTAMFLAAKNRCTDKAVCAGALSG
jgi:hypothetical protein